MKKILLVLGLFLSFAFLYAQKENNETTPAFVIQQIAKATMIQEDGAKLPAIMPQQSGSKSVIFSEGFESSTTTGVTPAGWTASNTGTGNDWVAVASLTGGLLPHSGTRFATNLHKDNGVRDAWMFSPGFTLTQGVTYNISFWLDMRGFQAERDHFEVKIAQTPSAAGMNSGTELYYNTNTAIPTWTKINATFIPSTTGTYHLGFHAFTPMDLGNAICIDDIEVSTVPNQPTIDITTPIAFGTVYNNAPMPYTRNVTIANTGLQPLTVELTSISSSLITVTGLPVTIPAASSATITVTLDQTALPPGAFSENFVLKTNDPENPTVTVAVTANVQSANILCSINENFNGGAWPAGWLQAGSFSWQSTGGIGNSGCVRSNLWSSNQQAALQPPFVYMGSNPVLSFHYNALNFSGGAATPSGALIYAVFVSTDFGATFTSIHQGTHVSSTSFAKIDVDVSAYAGQVVLVQLGFYWQSGDYYVRVDDVTIGTEMQHDLAVSAFTGALSPMATKSENYSVTVRNLGKQTANNYTVSILGEDNTVLATQNVTTPLAVGATNTLVFPLTFLQTQSGTLNIKAVVTYGEDECLLNNTAWLALNVNPHPGYEIECDEGVIAPTPWTGVLTLPANTNYDRSYTQQIFMASELNLEVGATITSIAFQYINATPRTMLNQAIYLGNTTKATFANTTDWIPVAQLTQVVNTKNIPYNNSQTWFTIELDVPFVYTGDNLVLAYVNNHAGWTSGNFFNAHNTTAARTIHRRWDGAAVADPAAPGTATAVLSGTAARSNVSFLAGCTTYYTLNPWDVYGTNAVVTLDPDPVPHGQNATVYFDIDNSSVLPGGCMYEIVDILVDGESIGTPASYTFPYAIVEPLPLIQVITGPVKYPIVATHGPNGTITPAGTTLVPCGAGQKYILKPDCGYTVDTLLIDGIPHPIPSNRQYHFIDVTDEHTIHVTFKEFPNRFITYIVDPHNTGTIIPVYREDDATTTQATLCVDLGTVYQEFIFEPNEHYEVASVLVNGVPNPLAVINQGYVFTNITTNQTLKVTFKLKDIFITAMAGPNGTIDPMGTIPVPYGTDKTFTITPNTGYVIHKVVVDGVEVNYTPIAGTDNGFYTFSNVVESHTIAVTFTRKDFCIYATTGPNGTIVPYTHTPPHCVPVLYNDIKIFTFIPEVGYKVSQVLVDGVPYAPAVQAGEYTFWYITNDHTIHVDFEIETYPITAMINGNGTITPAGTTYVNHTHDPEEISIVYTIMVLPGYEIANLFVDGTDDKHNLVDDKYYFYGVTGPHTISVITAPKVLTIAASAGEGGYITPSGNIAVNYGQNRIFNFTPTTEYEIEAVLVNGMPNGEAVLTGTYAFLNVTTDQTIEVIFKKKTFKMLAKANDKGSIAPEGITNVVYGEDIVYTITPDAGYKVSSVLVNGVNMGAITTYTFNEVEADGTIEAFFTLIVGVEEQAIEGVTVYSQNNIVYVVNANLLPIRDVSIIDMYGRVVWQGKVYNERNEIKLDVATGVYNVRVATEEHIGTTKVFIQR
ncbi:MAG: choice-of-anchor J domain-containing protein [Bacteroidetes bacterium]|nr:choice-of-anchor J domain-containing protein [Bacteroidota bacterium]MCL2303623.1 choice-of-anchor J domain-containing protein [Lentimicrobiaceae bacterium]